MAHEIERKFLLKSEVWRGLAPGVAYRQGYLSRDPERTVRIRIAGETAYLTVKGANVGNSRPEFEYAIPLADAEELLPLCLKPLVEKIRCKVEHAGHVWEVDEYQGENAGLVVAEIEMAGESEQIELPEWIGAEVSGDARYYNSSLSKMPYRTWVKA